MPGSNIAKNAQASAQQMTAYDMVKDANNDTGIAKTKDSGTGEKSILYNKSQKANGWRVAGYHVLNFLTLGISGAAGSLCANSQAMGSQKDVNSTRHFGQLHNAATHINANDSGATKTLKCAAKVWSSLGHVLLSPARLLQNKLGPGQQKLSALMKQEGHPRGFGLKGVNASAIKAKETLRKGMENELKQAGKDSNKRINAFANPHNIDENNLKDYTPGKVRHCVTNASPSLKQAFYKHADTEFSKECVMFAGWACGVLAKNDPNSIDYDPNARISKKEALDAYDNFIQDRAEFEININYKNRTNAANTMNSSDPNQVFGNYKERLQDAEREVKNAKIAVENNDLNADARLELAERNLKQVEEETFDVIENQTVVNNLIPMEHEITTLNSYMLPRFCNAHDINIVEVPEDKQDQNQ